MTAASRGWLLDTNVVSELRPSRRTAPSVAGWFGRVGAGACFISSVTVAELQHGIELADEARRGEFLSWLRKGVLAPFAGRIVDTDRSVLLAWLRLIRTGKTQGRTLPQPDSLIAATAKHHNLILATRNTRDFGAMGIELLNPWET